MNLFELFVKIGVDDQASDKISNLSSKLGNGLKTAAKIGTAAVGAAATGIAALTKSAVENYAEYEQLVGGVETLFKTSSDKVMEYAENAYKTAGLSANEYMNTVTSFSASLLQSLGGDTEAAAKYADMAITDMSDNANKMGTSMEMIQNAYQGFAKQNYTMLDNLKIGYGGTKEEMQRLLEDAEKLSGIEYDISSYADIVDAIHVVQTEMGITGTTAKEASTTVQGSIASMKSAYENFVIGLGDQNADIAELSTKLLESAEVVAGNLLPVIENILSSIGTMMQEKGPEMIEKFVSYAIEKLPQIIELGLKMVLSLVKGLANNLPKLVSSVLDMIATIVKTFVSSIPDIVSVGKQIVEGLWNGIKSMASWITNKVKNFFSGIVDSVKGVLGIHSPSRIFAGIGENMALGLSDGWDSEYNKIKRNITNGLDFGTATIDAKATMSGKIQNALTNIGNIGGDINIVVQSVLDGKIIGETAYKYNRQMQRAMGV